MNKNLCVNDKSMWRIYNDNPERNTIHTKKTTRDIPT